MRHYIDEDSSVEINLVDEDSGGDVMKLDIEVTFNAKATVTETCEGDPSEPYLTNPMTVVDDTRCTVNTVKLLDHKHGKHVDITHTYSKYELELLADRVAEMDAFQDIVNQELEVA